MYRRSFISIRTESLHAQMYYLSSNLLVTVCNRVIYPLSSIPLNLWECEECQDIYRSVVQIPAPNHIYIYQRSAGSKCSDPWTTTPPPWSLSLWFPNNFFPSQTTSDPLSPSPTKHSATSPASSPDSPTSNPSISVASPVTLTPFSSNSRNPRCPSIRSISPTTPK
ncbi:hypothetical protein RIF29_28571 [Crotalaria pallida]|uniref:Uncharacterized protein n=1 Tax=Crotalaria pallida TaxID=3830 RepID=A0AAN9ECW8_CROPI